MVSMNRRRTPYFHSNRTNNLQAELVLRNAKVVSKQRPVLVTGLLCLLMTGSGRYDTF